jgi:hypothetical protein
VNNGFGDAGGSREGARRPLGADIGGLLLRRGLRLRLQYLFDHLGNRVDLVGARPILPQLVVQPLQPQFHVPLALLAKGHARQPHSLGDGGAGFADTAGKQDLGALHDRMGQ